MIYILYDIIKFVISILGRSSLKASHVGSVIYLPSLYDHLFLNINEALATFPILTCIHPMTLVCDLCYPDLACRPSQGHEHK